MRHIYIRGSLGLIWLVAAVVCGLSGNFPMMILSDFSFALVEHEMAGLIGLNGGGKTTFLKVLSGLLPAFRSEGICFCGSPVDFRNRDFKLCRYTVFAEDNSFSYFTFREYLAYVCAAYGKEVTDVSELIQGFHFEEYTNTLLRELSTGKRHS